MWTDETKIELFSHIERCYVWQKPKTAFEEKNLLPTVKRGEESIMVWECFAALGTEKRSHIKGTMNSNDYQKILRENVRPSVRYLRLGRGWILQQDNDSNQAWQNEQTFLRIFCQRLITDCRKRLVAVIAAKGGPK